MTFINGFLFGLNLLLYIRTGAFYCAIAAILCGMAVIVDLVYFQGQ